MDREDPAPKWAPERSASFWINRASRILLRLHESRLRPLGFGMSQMPVLHALEARGALSQKDLAQLAKVEQPTMAEMLARMERDGMIERAPNPHDARGSLISLTRKARSRLTAGKEALLLGEREAVASLTDAEKKVLIGLLRRVVAGLESDRPQAD